MNRVGWGVLALLCAWGFITLVRRMAEARRSEQSQDGEAGSGYQTGSRKESGQPDDEIDWEELRRAEDEVRNLDIDAKPEDGFEGDDWGPGSVQPPKPPLV